VLPSELAKTVSTLVSLAEPRDARWRAVLQATGVGYLGLDAAPDAMTAVLLELRAHLEQRGGSLVVLRQPPGVSPIEAWGSPGDALPLMRAVKQQFDANGTLNQGRFIGGL
jgi:glycolate oxidase FAD binding subunit